MTRTDHPVDAVGPAPDGVAARAVVEAPGPSPGADAPTWPSDDAVRADPDASYARAAGAAPAGDAEVAVVSAQLGRPARGRPAVVHRCVFGLPTVVRVDPHLEDGTPFPTVLWLSCPVLRSRVGTLEADHAMVGLNERLADDPALATGYAAAAARYVALRDDLGGALPGDPAAGGMPRHVKCLHVQAAHTLATGDNPVGRWTLDHALPVACVRPCAPPEQVAAVRTRGVAGG